MVRRRKNKHKIAKIKDKSTRKYYYFKKMEMVLLL